MSKSRGRQPQIPQIPHAPAQAQPITPQPFQSPANQGQPAQMMMGVQIQQSPMPSGEMLDGLQRHIPDVGPRWMNIFESQVRHEHDMARESLRVNEELNKKNLDIQAEAGRREGSRILIAQLVAGGLLLFGLVAFVAMVGVALWFFGQDKALAGSVSLAIAGVFGYYFKSVITFYFPGKNHDSGEKK